MGTAVDKMVEQVTWAANNTAYNIDFIPDEKWDWKPAETAKSAREVANHMIGSWDWTMNFFKGEESKPIETKTKKEAQKLLKEKSEEFVKLLKSMTDKQLEKVMALPWGEMKAEGILGLGVIDAIHHRGQIVYIQTILGDTQDHFQM